MAKAGGDISGAVELLNKYLEMYVPTYLPGGGGGSHKELSIIRIMFRAPSSPGSCRVTNWVEFYFRFMADYDAWRELAEIYVSQQM